MYDKNNNPVGSFEGFVTSTSDIAGIYTKAILVTANDGDPTSAPGRAGAAGGLGLQRRLFLERQHLHPLHLEACVAKDVVQTKFVSPLGVTHLISTLNASSPPPIKSLKVPGGYTFVPVSELQPIGVNGLPPREVIIQGYQQYDVYDSTGTKIEASTLT